MAKSKYRIKLKENHNARPDQIVECVTGKLYLKDVSGDIPALYTRGEAIKKSSMFKGSLEKYVSKYELADVVDVAQIRIENIPSDLLSAVESQEPSYIDADKTLGEKMFSVDVLDAVIQESYDNEDKSLMSEAMELRQYVGEHCYFLFTKV